MTKYFYMFDPDREVYYRIVDNKDIIYFDGTVILDYPELEETKNK